MEINKICFIACVNDEELYAKSLSYIEKLKVPENIIIEILALRGQESMTKGYNNAMRRSNAKYKVYMHQDVLIINENFISDVLDVFRSNNKIGMMGVIGCETLPPNGIWWEGKIHYGKVYDSCNKENKFRLLNPGDGINDEYNFVEAIDGLIIITQYDVAWREDIFTGWHFYDASQSQEFMRKGYKVAVPRQELSWVIHYCNVPNMNYYEYYQKNFLSEYKHDIFKRNNRFQKNFLKTIYNKLYKTYKRLLYLPNKYRKQSSVSFFSYDEKFYEKQFATSLMSAEVIIPILIKLFNPKSVIDVGCGIGAWLSVFQNRGINIIGADGDYVPREMLRIDENFFVAGDLSTQIPVKNKCDMVVSFEIAGDLPEERAEFFVKELVDLAPVVVFSSLIPSEEEPQHINPQWPDYWASLFKRYNYYAFDIVRTQVWDNPMVDTKYKTGVIVYCDKKFIEKYPELLQWRNNIENDILFNIIHPDIYAEQANKLKYYKDKRGNYKKRIHSLALTLIGAVLLIIGFLIKNFGS